MTDSLPTPAAVNLSDDVVRAAREGGPDALSTVYRVLAPLVRGYLLARGSEDPDALTNDVFVQVIPRLSTVTGGASGLRTLVFSVAHARLVDELRSRSRRPTLVAYDPEQDDRRAADIDIGDIDVGHIRQSLALLSDEQRSVLLMRVVGGLSIRETAAAVGRSPGAVKQLHRRALAALRKGFEEGEVRW